MIDVDIGFLRWCLGRHREDLMSTFHFQAQARWRCSRTLDCEEPEKVALEAAQRVSDATLDQIHPELRSHYRLYFQRGLTLLVEGWATRKPELWLDGVRLLEEWTAWYQLNAKAIEAALSRVVG